ncbi:MAG: glycosyltransferase family 2 protein [Candidatus Omnitrophica bacterium]|nr:glycosyltransferase family 2 protein [Candidatus Omnitrophota bacterium]
MISIILPVFKNASFLEELIGRIHRSLDSVGYKHEIVCVNDCCPESSLTVLKKIVSRDYRLKVVDLKQNVGQHKAVLIGMVYAAGDWIAVMDADLQDPPESLPSLIDIAEKNNAVVFAGRRGMYEPITRLFTSKAFKNLFSFIARVPRDAGMFFVISKDVKEKIVKMRGSKPFVIAMLGMVSIPKINCPVERKKKLAQASGYSSGQRILIGMRAVIYALQCRFGFFCSKSPDYTGYVRTVINGGGHT